jgi:carbon starvation protein
MNLLWIVFVAAVLFLAAYFWYGRFLSKFLKLDVDAVTPSVEMKDDVDYVPISARFLLGQHFSAIAAAGPIAGPILAAVAFGWLPAILWIVIGSIFIGGVHDMAALVASLRHKARSIPEVVKDYMSPRSFYLFLIFMWLALVYVIVVFTDMTATSFVGLVDLASGDQAGGPQSTITIRGGAIAASSLLYLALPMVMGLLMRYAKLPLGWATAIFVPLVGLAIWLGQYIPLDVEAWLGVDTAAARKIWDIALLVYCIIASVLPMWLLLQPRGYLGGAFLYVAIVAAAVGLLFGGHEVRFPAFIRWLSPAGDALFPFLFITIACGACSGFHAIVASGTTSKQLCRETDAKPVGYGAMLLEGLIAVMALGCLMMLAQDDSLVKKAPNFIYASGLGSFLETMHVPRSLGISFGLMAFTTFVYDTLDICTRLGRYIIEELTGVRGRGGRWLGTILTGGVPIFFVMQSIVDAKTGQLLPAWKVFWPVFGASNQLLAALTLLGVTIWLIKSRRQLLAGFVTGIPTLWMYAMSLWSLGVMTIRGFKGQGYYLVPWICVVLIALAVWMLFEAVVALAALRSPVEQGQGFQA